MKLYQPIICAAIGMAAAQLVTAPPASAQAGKGQQPNYETPLYRPSTQTPLDQTYGLPTYGTSGNEIPKPPVTTPDPAADAAQVRPDQFKGLDVMLPSDRSRSPTSSSYSTMHDDTTPSSSTTDTPLYTTSEGMTTGSSETGYTTK